MATKKTMKEVLSFAAEMMAAANLRGARPINLYTSGSLVTLQVERTFHVQASVHVSFDVDLTSSMKSKSDMRWVPRVTINAPSINLDVVNATAMLALLQEVTMFAASLQAQLNEFEITSAE